MLTFCEWIGPPRCGSIYNLSLFHGLAHPLRVFAQPWLTEARRSAASFISHPSNWPAKSSSLRLTLMRVSGRGRPWCGAKRVGEPHRGDPKSMPRDHFEYSCRRSAATSIFVHNTRGLRSALTRYAGSDLAPTTARGSSALCAF